MRIEISSAYGVGSGPKSSFDSALKKLGIHEYNLIKYSSVVPEDTTISKVNEFNLDLPTGHPCAIVIAKDTVPPNENRKAISNLKYLLSDSSGGIFIEGNGSYVSENEVEEICNNRPDYNWKDKPQSISCEYESQDYKFATSVSIAVFGGLNTKYNMK